ncbi:MAG: hypothetical protein ACRDIY_14250, partial [Chloroflexota bacterium]
YNPGLVTALVLFLPFGIWAMTVIAPHATLVEHVIALVLAVGGHAAIVVVILGRVRSPTTPVYLK